MSKPISFGFSNRPKPSSNNNNPRSNVNGAVSKPVGGPPSTRKPLTPFAQTSNRADSDSEHDDDAPPKHEELAGFSASGGVILSQPKQEQKERVIENNGNGDWRKRGHRAGQGKNLLPAEVQAAQSGNGLVTQEKDEASQRYGLQYADKDETRTKVPAGMNGVEPSTAMDGKEQEKVAEMTDDDRALRALLDDQGPTSTAMIDVRANDQWQQRSEADDFRADVSMRPDSSTLEEYASMPVEEFGMAMLRGMGKKRRANGEVIEFGGEKDKSNVQGKERKKQEGFLGIGAKPVKGMEGVELGAWGKSDMRKNAKGEGFFTPVMVEDKRTGERISEEEFERRKRGKNGINPKTNGEDDWRERRDKNLERNGRNRQDDLDGVEDISSRKRSREERDYKDSRSGRDRHRDMQDDEHSSRSHRNHARSRSRDRRRHEDRDDRDDRDRRSDRDRHRDKYKDDDRYDSSSSRRSEPRHRDRDHGRDRDRDRDRDKDRDRNDRRYRDVDRR